MPGFAPGIHAFFAVRRGWPGRSPAMTEWVRDPAEQRADIGSPSGYINPPGTSGLLALDWISDMTGTTRSSGGLDDRRKRLLFRCWHRGTREMDLILGRFADGEIGNLSDDELSELERLIEVPDPDLYAAITGDKVLSSDVAGALFTRIKAFPIADDNA
jgi:antitoxin CptB